MNHSLVVDIDQTPCDVSQLTLGCPLSVNLKQRPRGHEREAYQLQPVCIRVLFHKIIDVSVPHPVRYHRKLGIGHRHSYQRQDVRMPEDFPRNNLLTESLHGMPSALRHTEREDSQKLTPMIFCKSLFEYVLITFTATSRPEYFPFHTSANPPRYNATTLRS